MTQSTTKTRMETYLAPTLLASCGLLIVPYLIYYYMTTEAPNEFANPLINVTCLSLLSILTSVVIYVKYKITVPKSRDMLAAMKLIIFTIPFIEEVIFRIILPKHLQFVFHPYTSSIICSLAFGLNHICNYSLFLVVLNIEKHVAKILVFFQVVYSIFLGLEIEKTHDFMTGLLLHMYYNVLISILFVFFLWVYNTVTCLADEMNFVPSSKVVSRVAIAPIPPPVQFIVPTEAERKSIYVNEYPRIQRRRGSDSNVIINEMEAMLKQKTKSELRIEPRTYECTLWRAMETQLQLQELRRESIRREKFLKCFEEYSKYSSNEIFSKKDQ
jgi:membrane protease YdiL (CAAX protease family)